MKMNRLKSLFIEELRNLYSAETQLAGFLPQMAEACSSRRLVRAFNSHLLETEIQIARLERLCENFGARPTGRRCKAMAGIIQEAREVMAQAAGPARDAALIAAAQKVEHYEIAGYGTARTYAWTLGDRWAASLLQQTLDEETLTDERLSRLAESEINLEAAVAV